MRLLIFRLVVLGVACLLFPVLGIAETGPKLAALQDKLASAGLAAHDIQMTERSGNLTLEGTVSSASDRQRIEDLARTVAGIRNVRNQLRVEARDSSLPGRILRALSENKRVGNYRIQVSDAGGVVTLTGRVSSAQDVQDVERIARSFPEVTDVRNDLVVPPPVPDAELERRVRSRLMARSARHLDTVSFSARDGIVTFEGSVSRHQDIDEILAETLMVSGVLDVRSQVSIGAGGSPTFNY